MTGPPDAFSRTVRVADLPDGETSWSLTADAGQCRALAERFKVLKVEDLQAEGTLSPARAGRKLTVRGRVSGRVGQSCVVTLEPVDTEIDAGFVLVFREEESSVAAGDEIAVDPDDDYEPMVGGEIDLAEAVAVQFALEIPDYPRADGADFDGYSTDLEQSDNGGDEKSKSPFSVLAKLTENR